MIGIQHKGIDSFDNIINDELTYDNMHKKWPLVEIF